MRSRFNEVRALLKPRRRLVLMLSLALLAAAQAVQMFYPADNLPPFAAVDGVNLGGKEKAEAVKQLNTAYNQQKIDIYLGESSESALQTNFASIGTTFQNDARLDSPYPWYLRLVPTSILWAGQLVGSGEVEVSRNQTSLQEYIDKKAAESCRLEPKSALLKANGRQLELVRAKLGLRCKKDDLLAALKDVKSDLTKDSVSVKVDAEQIKPVVDDQTAEALARQIENNTSSGVVVIVNGENVVVPQEEVLAWLDFRAADSGALDVAMNSERAGEFLTKNISPRVAVAPGVSYVTTRDFAEVSRKDGKPGQALNVAATLEQVRKVVVGEAQTAAATTVAVPPKVEYTRTYSPTDKGLNALLTNYAKDNKGTFGVSLAELSGERRRAEYNGDRRFVTASTYKLFVAYSTLKRVEAGQYSWSDQVVGGRPLSVCFDDMIARSDNPCAETLMERVGFRPLTDEAKDLGLKNTTFLEGDRPLTSANDLTTFLATLQSGQMLKADSRQRLIGAMERNIFRQGIPAGSSGKVAGKVGFLDNLLHDAAIVKDSKGTYILTVLTEDSSWKAIADLTREIEKLRTS